MLQSDPTAAYGCLTLPNLESCQGYSGKVTPTMLRDVDNPYNTYRHAGLPPGPISNPGQRAVEAVVVPASTDYLSSSRPAKAVTPSAELSASTKPQFAKS